MKRTPKRAPFTTLTRAELAEKVPAYLAAFERRKAEAMRRRTLTPDDIAAETYDETDRGCGRA